MKHCVIIGGGIIGLCTAYYLSEVGHQVTILDQSDGRTGASYINSGILTPSHIVPLAAPGMISTGLKYMLSSSSPFYIKPRLDFDLIRWVWHFYKSANRNHVKKSMPIIERLNSLSSGFYQDLHKRGHLDFHLEQKGLLMAYKTNRAQDQETRVVLEAQRLGLKVDSLSPKQVFALQPNIEMAIKGAFQYHCDSHATPQMFMSAMKNHLLGQGVSIVNHSKVLELHTQGYSVNSIETASETYHPDEIVIASGVWTKSLLKKIGFFLPLESGKGYAINVNGTTGIDLPAILMEAKVAVTPMHGFTRFGGTMEISEINSEIKHHRVSAIERAARSYYPSINITSKSLDQAVSGMRPLSPDGLPYIGRVKSFGNVVVATGHGMMGWSLGPVTGRICQQIIDRESPVVDIAPLSLYRHS